MTLDPFVDVYLDHLRVERALSPHTLEAYARDLQKFVNFAESAGIQAPAEIDLELVSGWLASLNHSPVGARSAARHLSALRGWMKFLLKESVIPTDPTTLAARPRFGRPLPHWLSTQDVQKLLEAPDIQTLRGLRDRAMLSVAYAAGLRVSELINLKLGDVDFARGVVSAYGKGSKRRLVPLGELTLDHLREYLDARAATLTPAAVRAAATALVFASPRGGTLTRQAFWKTVRNYAAAIGIGSRVHPHQLRHTFATHLLAGGADLRSVQSMLGHADIATTEVYTHVTPEFVREAHRRSHPRG